jgi:hypothetical protein
MLLATLVRATAPEGDSGEQVPGRGVRRALIAGVYGRPQEAIVV